MNLLLLLSALLSALAGIGGQARAPDVARAVAGAPAIVAASTAPRSVVSVRPAAPLPTLAALAATRPVAVASIPAGAPIWATRRRE